jgi:hypothetical protein
MFGTTNDDPLTRLRRVRRKSIRATLRLGKFQRAIDDRKLLAVQLREAVVALKDGK